MIALAPAISTLYYVAFVERADMRRLLLGQAKMALPTGANSHPTL